MNQPPRHGVFFIHFLRLLLTAYEAWDRTAKAIKKDPHSMPSDPLIAIVFSALGAEAFINELAEMAQRDADMSQPGLGNTDTLRDLAATITAIDKERLPEQLQRKYLEASPTPRVSGNRSAHSDGLGTATGYASTCCHWASRCHP
jgi:hypothetical protein